MQALYRRIQDQVLACLQREGPRIHRRYA
jgi:hypothetical protein